MKKMTAVVAIMAVFTLAMCFIILGSTSGEIMKKLEIDMGQFGTMIFVVFLTCSIVQLFIGPLVDKVGYKPVGIVGFIVTSGGMFLLAFASSFGIGILSCFLLGIGAMCLNTVGNTLIPVVLFEGKDPARASNFGNAFFGLGLVVTPWCFVLFTKIMGLSLSTALSIFGVLSLIFLIFAITTKYPQVATGFKFSMAVKLLGKGAVLIAALALFCYIALEISMGSWINTFMTKSFNYSAGAAGFVLGFFGVAMMVGRFITSRVKNLTAIGPKIIAIMALVSVITIVVMIISKSPALAIAAIILTGLAFAPIFPTIVGITFAKFDPSLYGSIFGIIFAIGLLGGTIIPKIIGNLAKEATVQQSFFIAAIMAGILLIISLFIGKIGKPTKT